jgi:hypothetical protein
MFYMKGPHFFNELIEIFRAFSELFEAFLRVDLRVDVGI